MKSIIKELQIRCNNDIVPTIYIGGGTPSLLQAEDIKLILDTIKNNYLVESDAEITIECNPQDLSADYLQALRLAGINRLSIGIQSFQDQFLLFLGRRHTAQKAIEAIEQAKTIGFTNISIDLIYGIPGQTLELWLQDLQTAINLNIQHISTYCLTYEPNTPLTNMLERGEVCEVNDECANVMYSQLMDTLQDNGFQHYEVSNFCKSGFHSRHNSSYWNNTPYIGIGAAAHSYDGDVRSWNPADIHQYIKGNFTRGQEVLSPIDKYNETVMLSLRTAKGIDLNLLEKEDKAYFLEQAQKYISAGKMQFEGQRYKVTREGINILNSIIRDLIQIGD